MQEGKNRAQRRADTKAAPKELVAHVRYRIMRELVLGSDDPLGVIMLHIDEGLRDLVAQGGDPLEHGVITIGRHPSHPDDVTIEVKTDRKGGPLLVITAGADDNDDAPFPDGETRVGDPEPGTDGFGL